MVAGMSTFFSIMVASVAASLLVVSGLPVPGMQADDSPCENCKVGVVGQFSLGPPGKLAGGRGPCSHASTAGSDLVTNNIHCSARESARKTDPSPVPAMASSGTIAIRCQSDQRSHPEAGRPAARGGSSMSLIIAPCKRTPSPWVLAVLSPCLSTLFRDH